MSRPPDLDARIERIDAYFRDRLRTPYLFVEEARRAAGMGGDSEMVYGTTPLPLMADLLEYAGATAGDVFYDLGCGFGECVLLAALFCGQASGIEILAPLAKVGAEAAAALGVGNATIRAGDLRALDVRDGTLFFCYSTCMKAHTRSRLAEQVASAAPGARILTVTHPLDHPALELRGHRELQWEDAFRTVYLHVRAGP